MTGGSGFIGTNLIAELVSRQDEIVNFDLRPPIKPEHQTYWQQGDLLNEEALVDAILETQPDWVIHLAARTDCDEGTTVEKGYQVNTQGTKNLLVAVRACPSVRRLVVTSSQYVCGPQRLPSSDDDYFPHTVYGQSKVLTERLTREIELDCTWFLVRPVNIWGPYHERYSQEFWRIAATGLYLHPDVPAPTRTYGYVGNVVWQMLKLLEKPAHDVDGKVFYLGDRPIEIDRWSLGFNKALRGREALRVPAGVLRVLARIGDLISRLTGRPFYLTSSRLQSMMQDYLAPMESTFDLLGDPPWTLQQGIEITAAWYRELRQENS